MWITRRMPLHVGYQCNCVCNFCYYLSALKDEMYPFAQLMRRLQAYRRMGIESIDFTGGEPTIHRDIIRLVRGASELGFRHNGMITNGIALRRKGLLTDLVDAGIEIFNLSIHGHNAELHDQLTSRRGSFDNMMSVAEHLEQHGPSFGFNMVVNVHNYKHLVAYAEMVSRFRAEHGATFLVMSPLNQAGKDFNKLSARYSDIAGYLREAVILLRDRGFPVSWKFMPLCLVPECAEQSSNFQQFFLTPYDWNQKVTFVMARGRLEYYNAFFKNFSRFDKKQLRSVPFKILAYQTMIAESFGPLFEKVEKCRGCKYFYICDGMSTEYRRLFGADEIRPIAGTQVVNPTEFLADGTRANVVDLLANYSISAVGAPLHAAYAGISRMVQRLVS